MVTILNASDVDRTGMVRYTLLGGDDGRFAIGSLNGVVSTTSRLDRESKPSYTVCHFDSLACICCLSSIIVSIDARASPRTRCVTLIHWLVYVTLAAFLFQYMLSLSYTAKPEVNAWLNHSYKQARKYLQPKPGRLNLCHHTPNATY